MIVTGSVGSDADRAFKSGTFLAPYRSLSTPAPGQSYFPACEHGQENQAADDDPHAYESTRTVRRCTMDADILHGVHEVVASAHAAQRPKRALFAPLMSSVPLAVIRSARVYSFAVRCIFVVVLVSQSRS